MKKLFLIPIVLLFISCTHKYDIESTRTEYLKYSSEYYLNDVDVKVYSFTGTHTELEDELKPIYTEYYEYPYWVKRVITKKVLNKK